MRTQRVSSLWIALLVAGICWGSPDPILAQGRTDYFNVESPQAHPIEVFKIQGRSYLAVCNTPASLLEIWDTDESLPQEDRLLARIRTGLEPVSVRWNAQLSRLYTANFLGDSVSIIEVRKMPRQGSIEARLVRTVRVTDEPMDLAFAPGANPRHASVFVTHASLDAYGEYDVDTLQPVAPGSDRIFATVDAGGDIDGLFGPDEFALKAPRAVALGCGNLFIASMKGSNSPLFDFDVYRLHLGSGAEMRFSGLGTSISAMTMVSNGQMLVVGTEARNAELRDEAAVRDADTGFTRSVLHLVKNPCGASPQVETRDLNAVPALPLTAGSVYLTSTRAEKTTAPYEPVSKSEALAQPMGVIGYRSHGRLKAFVSAFGSDRLGVFDIDPAADPLEWPRRVIDIPLSAGSDNTMVGPRGLALKESSGPGPNPTGPRLYVLNRLDNSVTIIDPETETVVGDFALSIDPTPDYIRHGRRFLYSAELSGNGFVSCASCHIDGRTDGLGWDLGDAPGTPPLSIDTTLLDNLTLIFSEFPVDKSWMVTQSLQGLLNFEVDPESQSFFTNAPYHWRGDRADFLTFNVAFPGLLGGSLLAAQEMEQFEEMINSINYPPNPRQPIERTFSGDFGDPFDRSTGSGGQRGLKVFHANNSSGLASCGHCHVLPAGSNNRITEESVLKGAHFIEDFDTQQPVETPTLRGLLTKEAVLKLEDAPALPGPYAISGLEGVAHTGFVSPPFLPTFNDFASADRFAQVLFAEDLCGEPFSSCRNLQDLLTFVFEMDWGVAPRVGYAVTADRSNRTEVVAEVEALEQETARGGAGLAVQAWLGGQETGFWYDVTGAVPVYREEPSGAAWSRAQLFAALSQHRDRLVFLGTPLGDDRRIASPSGSTTPLAGPAPSSLGLLPMVPIVSYELLPGLEEFWLEPFPGFPFPDYGGTLGRALRFFQYGLLQDGPPGAFGLTGLHWDAPRIFRVAGQGLRPGAELHLFTHADPQAATPPDLNLGPEDPGQVLMRRTVLPLYPTTDRTTTGEVVWQTAVEAETETYYRLMLGGEFAPGVDAAYRDNFFEISDPPPVGMFDPETWNWHYFRVVNQDGTQGEGGWARITIE